MTRAALLAAMLVAALIRAAVAGDIQVTIKKGGLVVTGSDDADAITIDAPAIGAGNVRVMPGLGTTINGGFLPLVLGGLDAGGANRVTFGLTRFDQDLTVKTGKGDDVIDTSGAVVVGERDIDPGQGVNTVTLN